MLSQYTKSTLKRTVASRDIVNNLKMRILNKHLTLKLSILSFVLVIMLGLFLKGRITNKSFDSEKWKNWKETEETMSLRWEMMNSLRNNFQLIGKSKSEIIDLLGTPESEKQLEFSYYLGYSKHGINTGHLTINFDKQQKVKDYSVWEG